jgi:hypothetical protein
MRIDFLAASILLTACSHVNVTDRSNGEHLVTGTASSGGYTGSREEAIEQANDFCHRSRQQPVIASFDDKPELGPKGEHTSSVVFTCAAPQVLHFE